VEPSGAMGTGLTANATQAGITHARLLASDWLTSDPPAGSVALVNHVAYLTREIVSCIKKLARVGRRRVLRTVNRPPPPSWHRVRYHLVHGETEEVVPGHVELVSVLWELGILPDIRVLPLPAGRPMIPAPTRAAAIAGVMARFGGDQWTFWPLGAALDQRSVACWRHASTSCVPLARRASARAGVCPGAKPSSPGRQTRERSPGDLPRAVWQ
jgi:hypothetical protein